MAFARRNRIRDLRARKFWSQERLAREAGLSIVTVNRAETGRQVPTVVTQERIARALEVTRDVLFPDLEEAAS